MIMRIIEPIKNTPINMITKASSVGTLWRLNQKSGGLQIMAINTANKKGTMMLDAAFMPAITITKLARMINALPAYMGWDFVVMCHKYHIYGTRKRIVI
jgi:hypothetical protein